MTVARAGVEFNVKEITAALQAELSECEQQLKSQHINLFDGKRQAELPPFYCYEFTCTKLKGFELGATQLLAMGKSYECNIVSITDDSLMIEIESNLGSIITDAKIQQNKKQFIAALIDRFEQSLPKASELFAMSEAVLSGTSNTLCQANNKAAVDALLTETILDGSLNSSQRQAVEASYSKSLALLWGPPGTGKTDTIAKIVQAHLFAGRRVLLVSNANTAVDGALKRLAKKLAGEYENGEIVRLGAIGDDELNSCFPMVKEQNIFDKRMAPLYAELAAAQAK